jgi:hypothetical protein
VTTVEVRADERPVRVTTTFVNPSRDHRLRVHLPLPEPAAVSVAESAFGAVTRGLTIEGRPDERGLPTFPARRFVSAGGLTVVHDGVAEYELVDIDPAGGGSAEPRATALALTLLRATGMLSRLGMAYRPFPAGPLTPVDGLQLVGRPITALCAGADLIRGIVARHKRGAGLDRGHEKFGAIRAARTAPVVFPLCLPTLSAMRLSKGSETTVDLQTRPFIDLMPYGR